MNFNINLLSESVFFQNIPVEKILCMLNSNVCYIKTFNPKMNIHEIEEKINYTGLILDGVVDIIHTSINGDETIVNRLGKGNAFGNAFSHTVDINNLNDIRCATSSTILFINIYELLQECGYICEYKIYLFENIMNSLAKSNVILNNKIQIMSQKTLRDKLITYFEILSMEKGSNEITIPFNREQLASYLVSERSSVCRELSKLKNDNIISIKGNNIVLISEKIS